MAASHPALTCWQESPGPSVPEVVDSAECFVRGWTHVRRIPATRAWTAFHSVPAAHTLDSPTFRPAAHTLDSPALRPAQHSRHAKPQRLCKHVPAPPHTCSNLDRPPNAAETRSPKGFAKTRASRWICSASSLVGATTSPMGPSPFAARRCADACSTIGSTNAAVLPLPVFAMPSTSRPDSAAGSACAWIAVGTE
eukprot:352233-Chlamydomonas_euryale.AAC.3